MQPAAGLPAPAQAAATRPRVTRTVIEKPKDAPVATTYSAVPEAAATAAGGATESAGELLVAATPVDLDPTPSAPAVEPNLTPSPVPVTIAGCLEATIDEDRFRLTETEGADAPKARSWRSAFLKKRSAPVELVELSDPSSLRKYIGNRVMATGVLTSRKLHVRSLQSAGVSCD